MKGQRVPNLKAEFDPVFEGDTIQVENFRPNGGYDSLRASDTLDQLVRWAEANATTLVVNARVTDRDDVSTARRHFEKQFEAVDVVQDSLIIARQTFA